MQKRKISIVYNRKDRYLNEAALFFQRFLNTNLTHAHQHDSASDDLNHLHNSDFILFGSRSAFGSVSPAMQDFMRSTAAFWYQQEWKNKFAAGFTVSPYGSGDQCNALQTIATFAAYHTMHWMNLGVMPRLLMGFQTEGQNRFASYTGLMLQCCDDSESAEFHSGDLVTLELFAKRIIQVTSNTNYQLLNKQL